MSSYILGILFSFLFVKFNKRKFITKIQFLLRKKISNHYLYELVLLIYLMIIAGLIHVIGLECNSLLLKWNISYLKPLNLYNFITIFFLLDFSSVEKTALNWNHSEDCHLLIRKISRSITFGFVAPLLYLSIFPNSIAIVICLVFSLKFNNTKIIRTLYRLFSITPCLLTLFFTYILLFFTQKLSSLDYKKMFFLNLYLDPVLNVFISIACLMNTFMLIDYQNIYDNRVIKYGGNKTLSKNNLYSLITKSYVICIFSFVFFLVIKSK